MDHHGRSHISRKKICVVVQSKYTLILLNHKHQANCNKYSLYQEYKTDRHHRVEDPRDAHSIVLKTKNDHCHRNDKLTHPPHRHLDHNNNVGLQEDNRAQALATK
jgi:arginyl-tRNA--protein-N-Asp/Glu arginylyltransferase